MGHDAPTGTGGLFAGGERTGFVLGGLVAGSFPAGGLVAGKTGGLAVRGVVSLGVGIGLGDRAGIGFLATGGGLVFPIGVVKPLASTYRMASLIIGYKKAIKNE